MRKKEIIQRYDAAEEGVFPQGEKLLLICVNKTINIEDEAYTLLDRVRYSWKISPRRAEQAEYVLAVAHGLIVGVFEADEWLPATKENFGEIPEEYGRWHFQGWDPPEPKKRWGFRGREAHHYSTDQDECSKAFPRDCKVKIPCDSMPGIRIGGSFDCVAVRFANGHFAQDDSLE